MSTQLDTSLARLTLSVLLFVGLPTLDQSQTSEQISDLASVPWDLLFIYWKRRQSEIVGLLLSIRQEDEKGKGLSVRSWRRDDGQEGIEIPSCGMILDKESNTSKISHRRLLNLLVHRDQTSHIRQGLKFRVRECGLVLVRTKHLDAYPSLCHRN